MCFSFGNVKGIGEYELLGNTLDDSVGEAFDKVARMLDITSDKGVHGGRLIEDMASRGNDRAFPFPEPMKHRKVRCMSSCFHRVLSTSVWLTKLPMGTAAFVCGCS